MKSNPENSLKLSFAGKRILPNKQIVKQALEEFFEKLSIENGLEKVEFFNGLAEGSDLLAAELFLETPLKGSRILHAVIPMETNYYIKTIEDKIAKLKFTQLWETANRKTIMPIVNDLNLNRAYILQSDFLAQQGDVLLAVADTDAELLEGGTLDTINKFLIEKKPIFCFDYLKQGWFISSYSIEKKSYKISDLEFYKQLYDYPHQIQFRRLSS